MPILVQSYKHYLDALGEKNRPPLIFKVSILLTACLLIIVGIASSLLYYQNKIETPIRRQAEYLKNAHSSLFSTSQSIEEVLSSFQVAGAKVQLVDNLKESSASSQGFFVSLDDLEKSLSKIELLKNNITSQILAYSTNIPPQNFQDLNSHIISHLENSQKTLEEIYIEQSFIKDVLFASGPSFYLPTLTDETIWKEGNKEAIINYYKDTKSQADETLKILPKLEVPPIYKSYYDMQIAYLTLLVNVSDKIINTLSAPDDKDKESATQTEKAYQQLILAKHENEKLAETLLGEKKKIFDVSENRKKFARIEFEQNALLEEIKDQYATLPETKIDKIREVFWGLYNI